MKNASVALAIGVGYLLGRRRKMRLAAMLATATAIGGGGSLAKQAIKRGGKLLGSSDAVGGLSPEISKLAGTVRSDLADAGKAAARSALNSRIDSLSDSIHSRAEAVRGAPGVDDAEREEPAREEPESDEPDRRDSRPPRPRQAGSGERPGDRRPVRRGSADKSASRDRETRHEARPSRSEHAPHRSAGAGR